MLSNFFKLFPMVMRLMGIAEKAFDGKPESGSQKKALVVDVVKTLVDGATDMGPESWNELDKPINDLIDTGAGLLFSKPKGYQHTRLD